MTGSPVPYEESSEYYRRLDLLESRVLKRDALDSHQLIHQVGFKVLLIEEANNTRYGVMDGVVVKSDDESVLIVEDISDWTLHRFAPSNFDWYQSKYFVRSTWLSRKKYMTPEALQHRALTYQLFDAALARGIYKPDEVHDFRDSSDWALRWNLGARLNMSTDSSWSDLMTRIEGM